MKRTAKQILSIFLSLVVVLSSLTLVAFAEDSVCTCGSAYENGFCKNADCGAYEPAVETTGKYMVYVAKGDGGYRVTTNAVVYEISNAGQLYWFAEQVNSGTNLTINGVLMNDIVINTGDLINYDGTSANDWKVWTPIGNETTIHSGWFDGNGYTVSGLYFNDKTAVCVGLFGKCSGIIKNITVDNSYFVAANRVAGICGILDEHGLIENATNKATVLGYEFNTAGVCGNVFYSSLSGCKNFGKITSYSNNTGGICGSATGQTYSTGVSNSVYGCINYGDVTACNTNKALRDYTVVGGICGSNVSSSLSSCKNYGTITGEDKVGGICGHHYAYPNEIYDSHNFGDVVATGTNGVADAGGICGTASYDIRRCSNSGTITGNGNDVGGIVGSLIDEDILNCYNVGKVNGNANIGGIAGNQMEGSITYCHNYGEVKGTSNYVGAINGNNSFFSSNQRFVDYAFYLEGSAIDGSGFAQNGTGCETLGEAVADKDYDDNDDGILDVNDPNHIDCDTNNNGIPDINERDTDGDGTPDITDTNDDNDSYTDVNDRDDDGDDILDVNDPDHPDYDSDGDGFADSEDADDDNDGIPDVGPTSATKEFFESGEMAYILNGDKAGTSSATWEQKIGKEAYPNFTSDTVKYNEDEDKYYNDAPKLDTEVIYEIGTVEDLYWFAEQVKLGNDKINVVLTNDIVVNTGDLKNYDGVSENDWIEWIPIKEYKGVFDGAGHYISGLYTNDESADCVGFFDVVRGTVKNLSVVNSYFKGATIVGGIAGGIATYSNELGGIFNCYSDATVVSAGDYAGGIFGYGVVGIVDNCYNTGSVTSGGIYAGGICGLIDEITVSNCYNYGTVQGASKSVGAVCGGLIDSTVTNCYYLEGCAKDGNDVVQNGIGSETLGSTTTDTQSMTTVKTADQFASGEVCVALNGENSNTWKQTIGEDIYPNFIGGTVAYNETENKYYNAEPKLNSDGYYEITNEFELYWFAEQVNSGNNEINGILKNNIYVNEGDLKNYDGESANNWRAWTPIGMGYDYNGTFDGNGYYINGLYYNDENGQAVGLFGVVEGVIKNVGIKNSYFHAKQEVGGICGTLQAELDEDKAIITNCYSDATVTAKRTYVGGICGLSGHIITDCYNTGIVTTHFNQSEYVGGIVGMTDSMGLVSNCYNTGDVTGMYYIGGIVGGNRPNDVVNCYNTGNITGYFSYVGGICGANAGKTINCYNTGDILCGETCAGGIVGQAGKEVLNCYNTGKITCYVSLAGGICGWTDTNITNCHSVGMVVGMVESGAYCIGAICGKGVVESMTNCYYLSGCATDGAGATQNGLGVADLGAFAEDGAGTIGKTADEFASGEICYLLNGEEGKETALWKQTVGTDEYPKFEGETIYYGENDSTYYNGIIDLDFWKHQIRFDTNADGTDAGTFDFRVLASMSSEDLLGVYDSEASAAKGIKEIGFIMTKGDSATNFDYAVAKATALGIGNEYTKVQLQRISTGFNTVATSGHDDYVISCLVTDVPKADKGMYLMAMAYMCYEDANGNLIWEFSPTVYTDTFEEMYDMYYSKAFPS